MKTTYCYNITFLVSAHRRAAQTEWIDRRMEYLSSPQRFCGLGVRVSSVVSVPGMADYGMEETSITAQFEFGTQGEAESWGETHLQALAGGYARSFGEDAYVMPSIIEVSEIR